MDNGKVSLGNPTRQSLITFADRGKNKAQAVAENAKQILPTLLEITPFDLTIPIPGRYDCKRDLENMARLIQLVKQSDIVFMLTDSRESRWLPTLLTTALEKIGITVALGFSDFLITRHTLATGCYFCPDPSAHPNDSTSKRPLDMQCTVSRPGLSLMAAGLAIEMLTNLLLFNSDDKDNSYHIRGFLSPQLTIKEYETKRALECCACGSEILNLYQREGSDFINSFLQNPSKFSFLNPTEATEEEDLETF